MDRSFGRFFVIWTGQLVSSIGSGLTAFALGVYAFEKTQSATVFSLIILFAFLPSYLLKPVGGTLSDRFDRRWMMIVGDMGSALGLLFIFIMFCLNRTAMWVIYCGVAASSAFIALQNPAYKSSITDLLDEESYAKASGLMQLAESSRFLISPILAGFLIQIMSIRLILLLDIASFVIAVLAVFAVRKNPGYQAERAEGLNFMSEFMSGFRYTFSHKGLVWLLAVTSMITFAVGFLQALIGPLILAFSDAKTLGFIQTVSATGMLLSSFFIGVFSKTKNQVAVLSLSLIFAGLFYVLFGTSTNLVIIIAAGFLFFTTLPFINTALEVLIRKNVDNQIQGRVWSIVSLISQLGMVIAFSIAGILADKIFSPLFENHGFLTSNIGRIIGTGPGRGIGFMFILSGLLVILMGFVAGKLNPIKAPETQTLSA